MDQHVQEQLEALRKTDPEVELMVREHRALDEKVTSLSGKPHLTPEEDVELHRLKKEKLRLRDRLEAVIHQQKSA
jgi:uncharacterized protein YdcH (DUF465 family)